MNEITLNNKNVVSFIQEANKKLDEATYSLGKCKRCGKPAFGWYKGEKLCQNCIVKLCGENPK